jgi:hypothetical protein
VKKLIVLLSLFISFCRIPISSGQNSAAQGLNQELNIYLDCILCDMNYVKENLTIVNYVREPALSDLQIQITTLNTGSGGEQYNMIFIGRKRFINLNDTLVFSIPPDYTNDEIRSIMVDKIKLGMVPYLMKTAYAENLTLTINDAENSTRENKDPWKSWIFELDGSGYLFHEKFNKNYTLNGRLYAGKITPKIKIESNNYINYIESHFILPLTDTVIHLNTYQQGFSSSNLFVRSCGDHFGIGGTASFRKSKVSNLDFQMKFGPAIEYNVFKYEDASHKQLRFLYTLGYEHSNYNEITIFNKTNDYLYTHSLSVLFMYIKPWGYFNCSLLGSSYLHDFSKFSLGTNGLASVRITNGLSFNMGFGLYMFRDRIDLRMGNASLEEILTYQREMESNYNYTVNFGITFRFGSKFNNAVNPRFER